MRDIINDRQTWARVGYATREVYAATAHLIHGGGSERLTTACGMSYPERELGDREPQDRHCKRCMAYLERLDSVVSYQW